MRLGLPKDDELNDFKEIDVNNKIKLYVHLSLLNLDETYNPKIDVEWKIFGKGLVIKGI